MPTLVTSFQTDNGSSPLEFEIPDGTPVNSLLLLLTVTANDVAPVVPGGFALVAEITGTTRTGLYQKILEAGDSPYHSVSWASGNGTIYLTIITPDTLTYACVHQINTASSGSASTNKTWNGVTNTDANTLLLCFGGFGTSASSTPNAGMSERFDGSSPRAYLMTQVVAATGATGTRTATGTSVATQRCITISISETNTFPISYPPPEERVTELSALVEIGSDGGLYVTQFASLAEIAAYGLYVTELGVLTEVGQVGLYVTQMGVLIEIEDSPIDYYAVAPGHGNTAFTRLTPQPATEGLLVTRRVHGEAGTQEDEFLYTYHLYNVLGNMALYRAVLDQYGLLTAKSNEITVTAKSQRYGWQRYNAVAVRPRVGVDMVRSDYFPRAIRILLKEMEMIA